jgi:hypothetical protein
LAFFVALGVRNGDGELPGFGAHLLIEPLAQEHCTGRGVYLIQDDAVPLGADAAIVRDLHAVNAEPDPPAVPRQRSRCR